MTGKKNNNSLRGARALVAGGTGFIGRRLTGALLKAGAREAVVLSRHKPEVKEDARWVRCDLTRSESVTAIKKLGDFDYVFNLTGLVDQRLPHPDPLGLILANLAPLIHLTEGIRWERVRGAVHTGSSAEYGEAKLPHTESRTASPTNLYGWSKLVATEYAVLLTRAGLAKWCAARPFLVYGPGRRTGLVAEIFRSFVQEKPVVLDNPLITRDPVFVDDAAEGLIRLALAPKAQGEIVNISGGRETTVEEIARLARTIAGRGRIKKGNNLRPGDFLRSRGGTKKLFELTGFRPRTRLAAGLKITYQADYAR